MKAMPTAWTVMESLCVNISRAYELKTEKATGGFQFVLKHGAEDVTCAMVADGQSVELVEGRIDEPVVTLESSFYDWLDLSAGRLHPVLGVMRRKLKFTGDTSFFSKVMPDESYWERNKGEWVEDPPTAFERDPAKHWVKPKRALVINGSPRGNRGYTEFFQNAFLSGLEQAGVEVETIHLSSLKINACTGCWHCWTGGEGKCVFEGKDDFLSLKEKYESADLIVFSFPLYVDGVPGILKSMLDRCVCLSHPFMIEGPKKTRHPRRFMKDQAMAVLSICGFLEDENFHAVREHFHQISHNMHMPIVAELFRSAAMYLFNHPGLFRQLNEVSDALEQAGLEVAEHGRITRKTRKVVEQKLASVQDFGKESSNFWSEKLRDDDKSY